MTRPVDEDASGAGAIFGLRIVEKERLRRIELEEGDGSDAEERDRDLCGNQTSGAPRRRRDVVSVAASARWRGESPR